MIEKKTLAIFDFDDTLTTQDSLMPFFQFIVGKWQYFLGLAICSPIFAAYFLKLLPNWQAKQIILKYFLAKLTAENLDELGRQYANQIIPKLIRLEAIERVKWRRRKRT